MTSTALEQITQQTDLLLEAAEQALRIEVNGETLTPEQEVVFDRLNWNAKRPHGLPSRRKAERARVQRLVNLEQAAGTPQARTAARRKAEEAASAAADELPKIAEQIEQLNRRRRELEQARDSTARTFEAMDEAASELGNTSLLPASVRKRVNDARTAARAEYAPRLTEAKQKLSVAREVARLDPDGSVLDHDEPNWSALADTRKAVALAKVHRPDVLDAEETGMVSGTMVDRYLTPRFAEWQAECRQQIPQLDRAVAELETECIEAESKAEAAARKM